MTSRYLLMALMCCCGYAQTEFPFAFDAVSVKISGPRKPGPRFFSGCRGGPETKDPGLWTCDDVSLVTLLRIAYGVMAFQVDAPGSVRGGSFDIAARVQPGASREQFRVVVQGFLAERFHLTLHWETREIPVYDLIVGKGGPRLKESLNRDEEDTLAGALGAKVMVANPKLGEDGYPVLPPSFSGVETIEAPGGAGHARLQYLHRTMEDLADTLTARLDRPVVDKTGLTGFYDISLYWERHPVRGDPALVEVGPSLEAAVRTQLGLALVRGRSDFRIIVVDHVDSSPSEN